MLPKLLDEKAIFKIAYRIEAPDARSDFLKEVCGDDDALHGRIVKLLQINQEEPNFLESPAVQIDPTDDRSRGIDAIDTQIGPYKIREQLGEGGMGIVYVAEQTEPVRRKVALKLIKPGRDTKQVIARFEAERQALALMDHPNIARVLDAGTTEAGRPYFVMELVRGMPINQFCDKARLTTRQRLELFITVCQAVQHAHQKGVIHRDIKPSNVLVTKHDGVPVVKVIDFGVAKALHEPLGENSVYTGFDQMVGTPKYMSPEQAEMSGLDIDTRTDIYSLGVLLYCLLTGKTPLDSDDPQKHSYDELRRQIREVNPPKPSDRFSTMKNADLSTVAQQRHTDPQRLSRDLRGDLDWIVMKALEKDRTRRYETANAFAQDVRRYLNDEPVTAVAPSASYVIGKYARRHKVALTTVASFAALLLVSAIVSTSLAVMAAKQTREARHNLTIAEQKELEAQDALGRERFLLEKIADERDASYRDNYAISNMLLQKEFEGKNFQEAEQLLADLADYEDRSFEWYYWQRQLHLESIEIPCEADHFVRCLDYSPDGKTIAVGELEFNRVRIFSTANEQPENVPTMVYPNEPLALGFAPVGDRLFVIAGRFVYLHDSHDGKLIHRLAHNSPTYGWAEVDAAFSPDGKRLVIVESHSDQEAVQIVIWEPSSDAAPHRFDVPIRGDHCGISFFPDGRRVAVSAWYPGQPVDERKVAIVNLDSEEVESSYTTLDDVSISPDGQRLARFVDAPDLGRHVNVLDITSGESLFRLAGHRSPRIAKFSADGQYIATVDDDAARLWDASTGKKIGHLTTGYCNLAFAPDSKKLATLCQGKGVVKIWDLDRVTEADHLFGAGSRHEGDLMRAAWAPDSTHVVLGGAPGFVEVWNTVTRQLESTLRRDGESPNATALDWSKDGKWIAIAVDLPDQKGVLRIWDAERRQEIRELRNLTVHTRAIRFSPDGRLLAAGYHDHLVVWNTLDWTFRVLLEDAFGQVGDVNFSPDSRELAAAVGDGTVRIVDVDTGRQVVKHDCPLMPGNGHRTFAMRVTYSPDGKRLAVGQWGGLYVIDRETQQEIFRTRDDVQVRAVSYSPDGRRLVTGDPWTGRARVWDASSGKELLRLAAGLGVNTQTACFSPDGRKIFVGGPGEDNAMVWFAATDREIEQREALFANYARRKEEAKQARQADEGAIKKWLALGPIPNGDDRDAAQAVNHVFLANEANMRPKSGDSVIIGDQEMAWTAVELDDYVFNADRVWPNPRNEDYPNCTAYAVTYIISDRDQENVRIQLGLGDYGKLFLNGKELHKWDDAEYKFTPAVETLEGIHLQQGVNSLVFKIANREYRWGLSVQLTDSNGMPLQGIHVSNSP